MPHHRSLPNHGFSVISLTVVAFVFGFIAVIGLYVWSGQHTEAPAAAQTASAPVADIQEEVVSHVLVTQWSIKIQMRDAEAVGYQYIPNPNKTASRLGGEVPESSIVFKVRPELLQNKDCKTGVGISRFVDYKDDYYVDKSALIGGYYYLSSGRPADCGNDPDNKLMQRIHEDFSKIQPM